MRSSTIIAVCATVLFCTPPPGLSGQDHDHAGHGAEASESPYTDLVDREIKALSEDEVESLLAGEGMGLALSAELNRYPGPLHVLEMADQLGLSEAQAREVEAIMADMSEEARRLGQRIVETERALDTAFADHSITADELTRLTAEIADLRGRLRAVHLNAHLETTEVMSMGQRHQYQVLRGYMQ